MLEQAIKAAIRLVVKTDMLLLVVSAADKALYRLEANELSFYTYDLRWKVCFNKIKLHN